MVIAILIIVAVIGLISWIMMRNVDATKEPLIENVNDSVCYLATVLNPPLREILQIAPPLQEVKLEQTRKQFDKLKDVVMASSVDKVRETLIQTLLQEPPAIVPMILIADKNLKFIGPSLTQEAQKLHRMTIGLDHTRAIISLVSAQAILEDSNEASFRRASWFFVASILREAAFRATKEQLALRPVVTEAWTFLLSNAHLLPNALTLNKIWTPQEKRVFRENMSEHQAILSVYDELFSWLREVPELKKIYISAMLSGPPVRHRKPKNG